MKRAVILGFLLTLVGAVYYYVLDGSLPDESDYELNIAEIRALAAAPAGQLPTEIRTEILAKTEVPTFAMRAGGGFGQSIMTRTVFQITTPDGHYALEAGMDKALAEEHDQANGFDAAVWERVQDVLSSAKGIIVTHEHPDHIGGIVRHRDPEKLADKIILTPHQHAGLDRFAADTAMPAALQNYRPVSFDKLHRIAPGIVMIQALGHTPGSVMFFVKLASGAEYLFIGDIAYTESNVIDGVDRARFVRWLMVDPENREAVVHQLKAIHELSKAEPELHIVPAHADELITRLIKNRDIVEGFILDAVPAR